MRWKKALTIPEAAAFVTGTNINLSKIELIETLNSYKHTERGYFWHNGEKVEIEPFYKTIQECLSIRDTLYKEAERVATSTELCDDVLNIHEYVCRDSGVKPDLQCTTFTKQSLAQWFYEAGDEEKARILVPNFSSSSKNNTTQPCDLEQQNQELLEEIKTLKTKLEKQNKIPPPTRDNVKPYKLIAQLIKTILPDANLTKADQVYSALNHKLGPDDLAVSSGTLKTYLGKY
jgi:hypothetical protein